jgi:hypothetical protein
MIAAGALLARTVHEPLPDAAVWHNHMNFGLKMSKRFLNANADVCSGTGANAPAHVLLEIGMHRERSRACPDRLDRDTR